MKKNKTNLFIGIVLFSAVMGLTIQGCKKENGSSTESAMVSNSRLKLSKSAFDDLYKQARQSDKKVISTEIKSRFPEFESLLSHDPAKLSQTALSIKSSSPLMMTRKAALQASLGGNLKITSNTGGDGPMEQTPTYDNVLTELVDDQSFQALLNVEGEIQVNNIIYKVTPYGTFFTDATNIDALNTVFADIALQNDYTLRLEDEVVPILMDGIQVQATEYDDVRKLNNNVFFVDSFIDDSGPEPEVTIFPSDAVLDPLLFPGLNSTNNNPPPTTPPAPSLPIENQQSNFLNTVSIGNPPAGDPAYLNMKEYPIEFKKGFAGIAQTIFDNSTRYNYFNNDYRISALIYNRNYAIIKTIGIKVKCQKKGWLWWNKTDAQEIRAGWDYIIYTAPTGVDKIGLPNNDFAPSIGQPYLINPTENPFYGVPMFGSNDQYAKRYNMYGWYMKRGNNEMFTISIPGGFVPFKYDGDVNIPSSKFKFAIDLGWNELKKALRKSAPATNSVTLMNPDPDNFKFPVYPLNGNGGVKYLSINDMENMPKSYQSPVSKTEFLSGDYKIHSIVSPYEVKVYNTDIIDIPLDLTSVPITLSTNVNNMALNVGQIAKSLLTDQLAKSYDVQAGTIVGAVKFNNAWRAVRINFKMKD